MSPIPAHAKNAETELDLARLQGTWKQTRFEENGVIDPPDDHGAIGSLTKIVGNHFSVHTADGSLLLEGAFALDASTTPKSITWIDSIGADKGKHLLASYTLDDDHFEFIASDEGMPRSVVFHTVPGQTMRTFVRHR